MNNSGKQQSFNNNNDDEQEQLNDNGLTSHLTEMLGDVNGDLLMTEGSRVMKWIQAINVHVTGACRVDERLKPLLKVNNDNDNDVAEDRLLSHLSQHFEPSEVGLLARCLCIPLVSVRVGKIDKHGTRLVPTSTRGNLVLSLLPTSDLRISFLADDGSSERLSILRNVSECSSVVIEGIPADSSGRSFAVRIPNRDPIFFWCSEKSRLLGNELLEKMKNLLERNPSLADLTGISDSRLQCFVHHFQTYLVGSNTAAEVGQSSQSPFVASKPSRARSCSFHGVLSPRPSSFKLRRRVEGGRASSAESPDKHPVTYLTTGEPLISNHHEKHKLPESSPGSCLFPSVDMKSLSSALQIPHIMSPDYCWCPPAVSTIQYTVAPLHMIPSSGSESFILPPLSSLLAASAPNPSPNLSEIPPFLALSISASQQNMMFTPLMCDPIVHVPLINICSSGQAYLVSGGATMSLTIPPVHNSLVQETGSEKRARDTLGLLISGSSQFPSVLANMDGGSRVFYEATIEVNAIANSIAAMSLVPSGVMRCIDQGDLVDPLKQPVETGGTYLNENDGLSEGSEE